MKLSQIVEASAKLSDDDPDVLLPVGNDLVEVCGVKAVGRNGITLEVRNPNLGGGVIVVDPEMTPLNTGDEKPPAVRYSFHENPDAASRNTIAVFREDGEPASVEEIGKILEKLNGLLN